MKKKIKNTAALVGVYALMAPVFPFYGLALLGEWSERKAKSWAWPQRLIDKVEAVAEWGDL